MPFFTKIRNLSDAVGYVRLILSQGVNNVELTDDVIRQHCVDAHQYFLRYLCGEGTYEDYLVFQVKQGVSRYQMPEEITDVFSFDATASYMQGQMFNQSSFGLLSTGFFGGMAGVSGISGFNGIGLYNDTSMTLGQDMQVGNSLTNWVIASQTQADMGQLFGTRYMVQYQRNRGELIINPTPNQNLIGVLGVWRKETLEDSLDHIHVKALMVGRCKVAWGELLNKYGATLAGGGSINGSDKIQQGIDECEKAINAMKDEREPLGVYIG